ncbi:MAG: hypothetical protein JWN04_6348 [Myxococcaceae bacterium]|nr:hypothetical protein [Myxococcaceae bacterium]
MLFRRPSLATSAQVALIFAAIGGCGSDSNTDHTPTFEADPGEVQSALTNPIIDCQQTQAQCLVTAAGDLMAGQACVAALPTCLQNAATTGATIQQSLLQCQGDAQKCVLGGGKLSECQPTFADCVKGVLDNGASDGGVSAPTLPTLPSGPSLLDGGITLPKLPTAGGNGGGQLPKLPSFPRQPGSSPLFHVDAGGLSLLLPLQMCLFDLNQCVLTDPSMASKCGDDARTCLGAP